MRWAQSSRRYRKTDVDPARAQAPFRASTAGCSRSRTSRDDPLHVDVLRAEGLDDAAISDAIQVVGYFNYVTRVADGVGIEDGPEWLSSNRS